MAEVPAPQVGRVGLQLSSPRMAKVTFLLGLCGSGKTFVCDQLKAKTAVETFIDLMHNRALPNLIQSLRDGKDCIVEEWLFCVPAWRDSIVSHISSEVPHVKVEFICFENDLESANWNVTHRKNKGEPENHLQFNEWLHGIYVYPAGAEVRPIKRIVL